MSITKGKKDEIITWVFLKKRKGKSAKKIENDLKNPEPLENFPSQNSKKNIITQSVKPNDANLMNNNWIVGNWFKTWPTREKTSVKEILNLSNNVYNENLKNNIASLDVITSSENIDDCDYILSTLKSVEINQERHCKSDIKMNVDILKKNHESHQKVTMDCALESLPLVYNPSTKQLQFVKVKNNKIDLVLGSGYGECILSSYLKDDPSNINEKLKSTNSEEFIGLLNNSVIDKDLENFFVSTSNTKISCNSENVSSTRLCFSDICTNNSPTNTIPSASTHTSLSYTDGSSFSSSNTDLSNISNTDSAICLRPEDSISLNEINYPKKRRGLTNFFNRNLFSWRQKNDKIVEGRSDICNKCDSDSVSLSSMNSSLTAEAASAYNWKIFSRGISEKNNELEAGSAGLIMQGRPKDLPAKTAGEEERHKLEYEDIVSAAKKKDVKDAKEKRRAQAAQLKQEKQLCDAVRTWNTVILPKWDAMHNQRKCQDLWWAGIPSCVRGKVWKLAIGNDLHLTQSLYTILVQRSIDKLFTLSLKGSTCNLINEDNEMDSSDQESTIDLIRLDVSRTFPHLCIFQKGGPLYDPLHNILGAYVCYRPDVGYVQGMSFLAATLLLNMDESDAFISFTNLLNRPVHMTFFCVDQPKMQNYYNAFDDILKENLAQLHDHLRKLNVSPDMFFLDWVLTVFARSLPLDVAARVWDVYLRDGEEFLFRAAIGILKYYEQSLLAQECTAMTAQLLTRLPDDLDADALFKIIHSIHTAANKRTFKSVLDFYSKETTCGISVV